MAGCLPRPCKYRMFINKPLSDIARIEFRYSRLYFRSSRINERIHEKPDDDGDDDGGEPQTSKYLNARTAAANRITSY